MVRSEIGLGIFKELQIVREKGIIFHETNGASVPNIIGEVGPVWNTYTWLIQGKTRSDYPGHIY